MNKNHIKTLILGVLIFTAWVSNYAQEKQENKTEVKWSGYIKADYIYDTRQSVSSRKGHFFLYPTAPGNPNDNDDNLNGFALESRLKVDINGSNFFGMKTSGSIEGDFFGVAETDINGFHLRNAYVKLSNDKINIIMGQYWHPMFVLAVSPSTYSFNAGVPYQPFNRSPQVRLETRGKNIRFVGALLTELDFSTKGASASRSALPAAHAQIQFGDASKFTGGFGVNVKTVRINKTKKDLTSMAYQAYVKTVLSGIVWKIQTTYGGNMTDLLQEGGFAMNSKNNYISNKTLSSWTEFSGNFSSSMEWGLFAGYTVNEGFGEAVKKIVGDNSVESTYRISPRIGWKSGKMKIGLEADYSATQYGDINKTTGKFVTNPAKKVDNFRGVASVIYSF